MDDDIQLPPIPNTAFSDWIDSIRRAAVLADRERRAFHDKERVAELEDEVRDLTVELTRERRAKRAKPVQPEVHRARLSLAGNGDWSVGGDRRPGRINILIHWTNDGRAWIDSARNQELARRLRIIRSTPHDERTMRDAADALSWESK